jgi:hypothetical protein
MLHVGSELTVLTVSSLTVITWPPAVCPLTLEKQVPHRRFAAIRNDICQMCGADEGDAREFAAEVGGVAMAVFGVVDDSVDVVEDVPFGDGGIGVVGAELLERPGFGRRSGRRLRDRCVVGRIGGGFRSRP